MRIAIVNDMDMAVESLRRVVLSNGQHELAWIARDGEEAVQLCAQDRPEVILMDLIMPGVDGVEATRRIMRDSPCAILVVTSSVGMNSKRVFEALGAGALDAVSTPVLHGAEGKAGASALLYKINSIRPLTAPTPPGAIPAPPKPVSPHCDKLVLLGASAGGPAAVAAILAKLPADFQAAVIIVQHLDAQFAAGLASWVGSQSRIPVKLIAEGDRPLPGTALVAATNDHLILRANGTLGYTPDPKEYSYRPSVDVFFESVLRHWKGEVAAAILTGMGRDGAKSLKQLREAGALTIAQSKGDCVVYGMPKAAAEMDAAAEILTLDQIAATLSRRFGRTPSGATARK